MGARAHQFQVHGKHAHSRKGQGKGVPRKWSSEKLQNSVFCPVCEQRLSSNGICAACAYDAYLRSERQRKATRRAMNNPSFLILPASHGARA